jgi:NAD(P)H dehydrogenase (quinone)
MILLTGAAGKTGRAILQALSTKEIPVRALVHRTEQIPTVEALGASDSVVGDLRNHTDIEQAIQGVDKVYHICPNVSPHEVTIAKTIIAAAQAACIEHFVYHSVLQPHIQAMPHHWKKSQVEEKIFESGIPFTILQPAAYMQNILAHRDQILNQGIYPVPYPVETQLSLVDLADVAQAAAIVLTEPGHENTIYELVGIRALSQTEVAEEISKCIDRPVRAEPISIETWEEQAKASGLGPYQVDALVKMFRYYQHHGFKGNPNVLAWLLGRPPRTFVDFLSDLKKTAKIV